MKGKIAVLAAIGAVGLAIAALLAAAAARNAGQLNPDAVVYLRLARYIVEGRFSLAVSGAFFPLLPCLISPFLAVGIEPLVAARIALALSGALFLAGSVFVAHALEVPPAVRVAVAVLAGLAVVPWSVDQITPDLLEDGLLLFVFGLVAGRAWPQRRGLQAAAGFFLALAYYTKAVALPLGLLLLVSVAVLRLWSGDGERPALTRALGVTLGVAALSIAPWVLILTARYGQFTIATSARMAHAIVGPGDVDRRNPILLGFRAPEPGRLTWGEDASTLPFRDWSPFESRAYADYQLGLISENRKAIFRVFRDADRWQLGFWASAALVLALAASPVRRWRPSRVSVVPWLVAAVYVPVYARDPRYFWIAYPFLLLGAAALAMPVAPDPRKTRGWVSAAALLLVVASFALPIRPAVLGALAGRENPAVLAAREAAARIRTSHLSRPIAGSGDIEGGMAGLYLAYFLDQPFYGDYPKPEPDAWARLSGALIVAARGGPLALALRGDGRFDALNARLFGRRESAQLIELFLTAPERASGSSP